MKVKNKYKINNSFIAGIEVMKDRTMYEPFEHNLWTARSNMMKDTSMLNMDDKELSAKQRRFIVSTVQDLRKNGFIK